MSSSMRGIDAPWKVPYSSHRLIPSKPICNRYYIQNRLKHETNILAINKEGHEK